MPKLIDLHERFNDRSLAIIGMHADDEVDTAAKLDEKLTSIRKKEWNGKDIAFPVALTSLDSARDEPSPVRDYGIEGYPTLVLIDREGKVVGASSVSEVEKLLKK
jgi:hypothetical protein